MEIGDSLHSLKLLEKTVKVGEVDVEFKSSATIPRLYCIKFKRDIFKDLSKLEKSYKTSEGSFEIENLVSCVKISFRCFGTFCFVFCVGMCQDIVPFLSVMVVAGRSF